MSELPPTKEIVDALKYAVAPSAAATAMTAVILAVSASLVSKNWRRVTPIISVIALATGMAAGNAFREVFPWVPDDKSWHWVWWAFGLALAIELIANVPKIAVGVGMLLRGTASGVVAAFVVPPNIQASEQWWVPATAFGIAVQWAIVAEVSRRNPGGWVAASTALVCGGAAGLLIHAEMAGFTDVTTFLLTSLGVLTVLAWLTCSDVGPAAAVAVVPVVSLLVLGRLLKESQVTDTTYLIALLSPLTLGLTLIPGLSWLDNKLRKGLLKFVLASVPVAYVLYRVMAEAPLKFGEEW